MANPRRLCAQMTPRETNRGWVFALFYALGLSSAVQLVWAMTGHPLSGAEGLVKLNLSCYSVSFLCVLWIFSGFLRKNLRACWKSFRTLVETLILGLVFCRAGTTLVTILTGRILPELINSNNDTMLTMVRQAPIAMAVVTGLLVPVTEECIFRGLLFQGLSGFSRPAAYLFSMLAFAMMHLASSFGTVSPLEFCLLFCQYLPAGLVLAWSYERSGTIFGPILIHGCFNLWSLLTIV